MSTTPKPDGGPAFPVTVHQPYKNGIWKHNLPGLSLRDHFAVAALQGMLSATFMKGEDDYTPSLRAHHAYQYADAMIAERSK